MTTQIQLGQQAKYLSQYSPHLLHPIARSHSRDALLAGAGMPFSGADIWTAYEISWLNQNGKPEVAMGNFAFPAQSEAIVESKSFKYYLNSFNQTRFKSWQAVRETIEKDLSNAVNAPVEVALEKLDRAQTIKILPGECIDECEAVIDTYQPDASLLKTGESTFAEKVVYSHLLKSNCPVTGQPDWASVWIKYSGVEIVGESLLKYIVSFREHQDFHENCVEKIFCDIARQCKPEKLTVYARYTRRGGLDINPFRTNCGDPVPEFRVIRQ